MAKREVIRVQEFTSLVQAWCPCGWRSDFRDLTLGNTGPQAVAEMARLRAAATEAYRQHRLTCNAEESRSTGSRRTEPPSPS